MHDLVRRDTRHAATAGRAGLHRPLKALSDQTNLEILTPLVGEERFAEETAEQPGLSQPAVSRHLDLMATASTLEICRRGSSEFCRISSRALTRAADFVLGFL